MTDASVSRIDRTRVDARAIHRRLRDATSLGRLNVWCTAWWGSTPCPLEYFDGTAPLRVGRDERRLDIQKEATDERRPRVGAGMDPDVLVSHLDDFRDVLIKINDDVSADEPRASPVPRH